MSDTDVQPQSPLAVLNGILERVTFHNDENGYTVGRLAIGPVMAHRMVEIFGIQTLEVIESAADKLRRVEGIGEKRIAMIRRAWDEQREIRNVMLFLQGHGVSATYAVKIYKTYGERSIAMVECRQ